MLNVYFPQSGKDQHTLKPEEPRIRHRPVGSGSRSTPSGPVDLNPLQYLGQLGGISILSCSNGEGDGLQVTVAGQVDLGGKPTAGPT